MTVDYYSIIRKVEGELLSISIPAQEGNFYDHLVPLLRDADNRFKDVGVPLELLLTLYVAELCRYQLMIDFSKSDINHMTSYNKLLAGGMEWGARHANLAYSDSLLLYTRCDAELLAIVKRDNSYPLHNSEYVIDTTSFNDEWYDRYDKLYDNLVYYPYFRVGVYDSVFINRCIADGIDAHIAAEMVTT